VARKRALSESDKANPDVVYDPELFRRDILPRLSTVQLSEIAQAASCAKASASDIRRGRRTPHMSTWVALVRVARVEVVELGRSGVDSSLMKKASWTD
jgi:hypothetical protein